MEGVDHSAARGALLWRLLSNPYCVSAAACGLLAVAVSFYLSRPRAPRLPPRLRRVRQALRRLSHSSFLFRTAPGNPSLVLCTQRRALFVLNAARDTDEGGVEVDGVQHTEHLVAHINDVRVMKHGLFFEMGRAIVLSDGQDRHGFTFLTRHAADTFLQLLAHVQDQRPPDTLDLFLTTFNVGNSQPPDDLSPWFQHSLKAHIVAIGVQECSYTPSATSPPAVQPSDGHVSQALASDDSSTSNSDDLRANLATLTENSASSEQRPLLQSELNPSLTSATAPYQAQSSISSAKEHWQSLLNAHFPESEYACIVHHTAWDRCLTIFVKKSLFPQVSNVRIDTANVGVAGVMGNKGAIGARFSVFDTEFLIINSHLAAHHGEVIRRNEDFSSIASGLSDLRDGDEAHLLADPIHYTFSMGDLNYRINLDRDEVLKHVQDGAWKPLQDADQLLQEMDAGRAFQGFVEGKTDFAPTYRYERGSRRYSSVKMRIPSYCDRILYRSLPGCKIELDQYRSADEIMTSDHSPVYASFRASMSHAKNVRHFPDIVSEFSKDSETEESPLLSKSRSLTLLSRNSVPDEEHRSHLQLVFITLGATDLPDMDNGGRRIAVAKALRIDNHLIWKKHDELGEGHYADPYCIFHGPAVAELDEGAFRTDTIAATQDPVWNAEQIPKVDLVASDFKALSSKYVIITVKDENPARRDGTIGSTILWLGAFDGTDPVQFSAPIMHGGLKRGLIVGRFVIR
ncbi:Inositol polyphosphate-related phosphatase [Gracilaria domingensis]|nr:Inositol polyphosphate-related phosphatase [Gracilaria domingensis]